MAAGPISLDGFGNDIAPDLATRTSGMSQAQWLSMRLRLTVGDLGSLKRHPVGVRAMQTQPRLGRMPTVRRASRATR